MSCFKFNKVEIKPLLVEEEDAPYKGQYAWAQLMLRPKGYPYIKGKLEELKEISKTFVLTGKEFLIKERLELLLDGAKSLPITVSCRNKSCSNKALYMQTTDHNRLSCFNPTAVFCENCLNENRQTANYGSYQKISLEIIEIVPPYLRGEFIRTIKQCCGLNPDKRLTEVEALKQFVGDGIKVSPREKLSKKDLKRIEELKLIIELLKKIPRTEKVSYPIQCFNCFSWWPLDYAGASCPNCRETLPLSAQQKRSLLIPVYS